MKQVDWKMASQLTNNPTKQLTLTHFLLIYYLFALLLTLPETNIAPENGWLED